MFFFGRCIHTYVFGRIFMFFFADTSILSLLIDIDILMFFFGRYIHTYVFGRYNHVIFFGIYIHTEASGRYMHVVLFLVDTSIIMYVVGIFMFFLIDTSFRFW